MGGAIDLYAGSPSIAGPNLFKIDHNPLDELSQGIQDVIGQQSSGVANGFITMLETLAQAIVDTLLGLPITTPINWSDDMNALLAKLGVRDRREAVARAAELGLPDTRDQ